MDDKLHVWEKEDGFMASIADGNLHYETDEPYATPSDAAADALFWYLGVLEHEKREADRKIEACKDQLEEVLS